MKLDQVYIDGAFQPAQSVGDFEIINPATGLGIGTLALSGAADADRAVAAARAAFDGWAATPVAERKAALERIVAAYQARKQDLADAMTTEMGAPTKMSMAAQYGAGEGHLKDFVKAIDKIEWVKTPDVGDGTDRIMQEPMGVSVLITPWNWPMNQITLKVGAGLAAG